MQATVKPRDVVLHSQRAEAVSASPTTSAAVALLTAAGVAAGVGMRLAPAATAHFPLGDGGMFFVMVRDLLAHHLVPPATTAYNHQHIPFAYPPLGFYLVAVMHLVTGVGLLTLFRWVPAMLTAASMGAFLLLARAVLPARSAAAAVWAFALIPDSYQWTLKGGGITRALGLLFALLAAREIVLLYRSNRPRRVVGAAVWLALLLLSHLEWTTFAVCTVMAFAVMSEHRWAAIRHTVLLATLTATIISPWYLLCAARYGPATLLAPLIGSAHVIAWYLGLGSLLILQWSGSGEMTGILVAAMVGLLFCIARRDWKLPLWLLAICLLDIRGPIQRGSIVLALLAGVGTIAILDALRAHKRARFYPAPVVAGILVLLVQASLVASAWIDVADRPLPAGHRIAMAWVERHTPPNATFVTVTGAPWAIDDVSEWLPALTTRINANTVQGTEWIPGGFAARYGANSAIQQCAQQGTSCLRDVLVRFDLHPNYLYVSRDAETNSLVAPSVTDCCVSLIDSLDHSRFAHRIYQNSSAAIYALTTR